MLQEGIDVLAIAIALRAVLPGRLHTIAMSAEDVATAHELRAEHDLTLATVERIRTVADDLTSEHFELAPVEALLERLEHQLIPHERADEDLLMPLVDRALGTDATATMRRTHAEIEHQVGRLRRLVADLDGTAASTGGERTGPPEISPEDIIELRRMLYGLYAVCRLHNSQEEEGAFALVPPTATSAHPPRLPALRHRGHP